VADSTHATQQRNAKANATMLGRAKPVLHDYRRFDFGIRARLPAPRARCNDAVRIAKFVGRVHFRFTLEAFPVSPNPDGTWCGFGKRTKDRAEVERVADRR
jgi:hypothetical protein